MLTRTLLRLSFCLAFATVFVLGGTPHAQAFDTVRLPAKPAMASAAGAAKGDRALRVAPTGQGRRVALVIGNGDYRHPDVLPRLPNPVNDAEDVARALRAFGFEVIERKNLTLEAMNRSIAEFGTRLGGSEAALFYFAGHGIQVRNQNYLMPVNATIESEAAVPYQGVDLNRILDEMDNAKSSANIVMLDACRNNPITGKFRSAGTRGLAPPGSPPKGTVIVYATDPGNTAADGEGRNGLFTAGLLTAFKGSDLSLDGVLTVASAEVERISAQRQTPYVNGPKTLQKNFHFRTTAANAGEPASRPGGGVAAPAPQAVVPTSSDGAETRFWSDVRVGNSREHYDAYLGQYPAGRYAALAKIELRRLDDAARIARPPPPAAAPPSSQIASPSPARPAPSQPAVRRVELRAPEIAENGAVVPVEVVFTPPLPAHARAEVRIGETRAAELTVLEGEVSSWSLRVAMRSTGMLVAATEGAPVARHEVRVVVGAQDDPRGMAAEPPDTARGKVRNANGEARILLPGNLAHGRLAVSARGFRVAIAGSPQLSRNPVFGLRSGALREGDAIALSLD